MREIRRVYGWENYTRDERDSAANALMDLIAANAKNEKILDAALACDPRDIHGITERLPAALQEAIRRHIDEFYFD